MKVFSSFPLFANRNQCDIVDHRSGGRRGKKAMRDAGSLALRRRRRRRYMALLGTGVACFLGPMLVFQITLYRQNLAVARETFPTAPAFAATDRLLIISPHCDDETLGAGGTIAAARQQGLAVRVAFLTNGDGSRSTQIEQDTRLLRRNSFQQLAAMRQRETVAALNELNVARDDIVFLGYPDGGTQTMWQKNWTRDNRFRSKWTGADRSPYKNSMTPNAPYSGAQMLDDVAKLISDFQPTVVFTTHPDDTHPDHWAAYSYTLAALEKLRLQPSTRSLAQRTKLLTFLVHHGVWPAPHGYHPEAKLAPPADLLHVGTRWMETPLDKASRVAKKAALERYVSQLAFTPHYLRGFLRRNELFGVVPLGSLQMEDGTTEALKTAILRDPVRDSFVHEVWAGGDIQTIWARQVTADEANSSSEPALRLRIQAPEGARASRRLSYRLALHAITPSGVRAANIEIGGSGSNMHASFNPIDAPDEQNNDSSKASPEPKSYALAASRVPGGVKVNIPLRLLTQGHEAMSLLVSASTYLGTARLDQTGTGAVRVVPPMSLAGGNEGYATMTARSPRPLPAHSRTRLN
ncbi:MAG TPA: PIG-L family deacetylase [Abditibacteriaceae bacterium]|jgi:LmbE family N-acetylglucosaminyl deacetylase